MDTESNVERLSQGHGESQWTPRVAFTSPQSTQTFTESISHHSFQGVTRLGGGEMKEYKPHYSHGTSARAETRPPVYLVRGEATGSPAVVSAK